MNSLTEDFNPLGEADDEAYRAVIRRVEVSEIVGSYHHPFDVFLEVVQNAVDACESRYTTSVESGVEYSPVVKVFLDLSSNTLKVADNGTGMSVLDIQKYLFTPFSSRKRVAGATNKLRGEKGVGSTFLAYSSNDFRVNTRTINGETTAAGLQGALRWLREEVSAVDMPRVIPISEPLREEPGTEIFITVDETSALGLLKNHATTVGAWTPILRLFTAIGYVDFDRTDSFLAQLRVELSVKQEDGTSQARFIDTGFLYPHTITTSSVEKSKLQRDGGRLRTSQRDKDVLYDYFGAEQVADRVNRRLELPYTREARKLAMRRVLRDYSPEAYVSFVHSAEFWQHHNARIWGEGSGGFLTHGSAFSTKRQRVAETQRISLTSRTGDFNRFFIVLNMKGIRLDIGRKSLPEDISIFADLFANSIRSEFFEDRDALRPTPNSFDEGEEATLERIRDKAYAREKLSPPTGRVFHLSRVPESEQDVIALFFDLLGADLIRGYEVYATHTAQKYDGVGCFRIKKTPENVYTSSNLLGISDDKFRDGWVTSSTKAFFEFKQTTDGLIDDLNNGDKRLSDIKWLICWSIGTKHREAGVAIIDIMDAAQVNHRDYHGITHLMTEGPAKTFVICLKSVIEYLGRS